MLPMQSVFAINQDECSASCEQADTVYVVPKAGHRPI